ncbi:MAG: hypothetical protein QGG71_02790 [Pirellulaceae bacterium]|nr:hypothetical protein [Pirellulaceae bacterium]
MKILKVTFSALIYLSVLTVLAEAVALCVVWSKGNLTEDTVFQMMAVAHDVDMFTMHRRQGRAIAITPTVYVARREVEDMRQVVALDLSMREIAIDKGLIDILEISAKFTQQWEEYKKLKDEFDWNLEQLRQGATDQAVKDVQRQLESLSPKLAKTQILKLLDDQSLGREDAQQFVVTVFKGMPVNNRKRIIEEFRTENTMRLHEILRQIRKGEPDVGLFRETRRNLMRFD